MPAAAGPVARRISRSSPGPRAPSTAKPKIDPKILFQTYFKSVGPRSNSIARELTLRRRSWQAEKRATARGHPR